MRHNQLVKLLDHLALHKICKIVHSNLEIVVVFIQLLWGFFLNFLQLFFVLQIFFLFFGFFLVREIGLGLLEKVGEHIFGVRFGYLWLLFFLFRIVVLIFVFIFLLRGFLKNLAIIIYLVDPGELVGEFGLLDLAKIFGLHFAEPHFGLDLVCVNGGSLEGGGEVSKIVPIIYVNVARHQLLRFFQLVVRNLSVLCQYCLVLLIWRDDF
jgi:hypothetical protein